MEKKIISKESLSDLFARDEIQAAIMLRDALMEVKEKTGNITDPDIKSYNSMDDVEFMLNLSLTTIKSYSAKYGFGVFNVSGEDCVVRQFSVDEYALIKKKLKKDGENNGEKVVGINSKNLTAEQRLALDFVKMADLYKEQTVISIRAAKTVQTRLEAIYARYSIFPKQYIISHLLNIGLSELEKNDEKIND